MKKRKLFLCTVGVVIFILSGFVIVHPHNIVGTWYSKSDSNSRWIFTSKSKLKTYYKNELIDTYKYQVSDTSPQCGVDVSNILQLHPDIKLLELTSSDNNKKSCYYIYSLDKRNLTLSPFKKGGLLIFKRK